LVLGSEGVTKLRTDTDPRKGQASRMKIGIIGGLAPAAGHAGLRPAAGVLSGRPPADVARRFRELGFTPADDVSYDSS
jgi:hypothetical protein